MSRVNVTVTSDGSWFSEHNVGGYAFQIRANRVHISLWGPFKNRVQDPTEAELQSLINSLYVLKHENIKINYLTINVDCEFIVKYMFKKKKGRRERLIELSNQVSDLLDELDYSQLNIKHVKAHTKITNSRRWVNDWCDKHAKKGAKEAIILFS